MTSTPRRLLLITPNFENNSLGRTFCLWLLGRDLGFQVRVVGVKGDRLWPALADSEFAADCVLPPAGPAAVRAAALTEHVEWSDVVIAVKPLPTSFGVALAALERTPRPFVLDIDDPDLEVRTIWRPKRERIPRWLLKRSYRATYRQLRRLRPLTATVPVIVSNPTLQATYGGLIVPHVRVPGAAPLASAGRTPIVRFVGSPNVHKGTDVLRAAVARLADEGFRLGVTAPAPADAQPWEDWYGYTSLEEGQRLVATADIIALPSLDRTWSKAQLPAKLMDAMVHGRVVVASDLPPIRWALDEPDLLVPPGDVDALVVALRRLADPQLRETYARRLRARAEAVFSVAASRDAFADLIDTTCAAFAAAHHPSPQSSPAVAVGTERTPS